MKHLLRISSNLYTTTNLSENTIPTCFGCLDLEKNRWLDLQELENCYLGRDVGSEKVAWLSSDDPRQEVPLGTSWMLDDLRLGVGGIIRM